MNKTRTSQGTFCAKSVLLLFFSALLLSSCGSKLRSVIVNPQAALPYSTDVMLIDLTTEAPDSTEYIGQVEIVKYRSRDLCNYTRGIQLLKFEAVKAGGNVLKLTEHTAPVKPRDPCHLFKAEIYLMSDEDLLTLNAPIDSNLYVYPKEEQDYVLSLSEYESLAPEAGLGDYSKLRIGALGGFSYLIAKPPEGIPEFLEIYIDELRTGKSYHLDAHYFPRRSLGIGLKYSAFFTENSLYPVEFIDDNGNSIIGVLSDDIRTTFIGPSLVFIAPSSSYTSLSLGLSFGKLNYENDVRFLDDFRVTGSTVGLEICPGLDINLNEMVSLALELNLMFGALSQIQIEDKTGTKTTVNLSENERENLGRVDVSAGLKFKVW